VVKCGQVTPPSPPGKTATKAANEGCQRRPPTLPLRMLGGLRPPPDSANPPRWQRSPHEHRQRSPPELRPNPAKVCSRARGGGLRRSLTDGDSWSRGPRFVWRFDLHREKRADQIAWHLGWRWHELANHLPGIWLASPPITPQKHGEFDWHIDLHGPCGCHRACQPIKSTRHSPFRAHDLAGSVRSRAVRSNYPWFTAK
jgi:hypothetical protein